MFPKIPLIGADIEVFLFDKVTNQAHSVEGLIGGTKEEPLRLDREGCAVQEDNVSLEYNVRPTTDPKDMWDDILFNLNWATGVLPDNLVIRTVASAHFAPHFLATEHAQKLGCEPDINVYTGELNEAPFPHPTLRTAGGHIHVATSFSEEDNMKLIKAMDLFLGVPSILLDSDVERRQMYGKAGAFRFKPYGVEYRTLSNFWTTSRARVEWAFNQVSRAYAMVESGEKLPEESLIIDIINKQNTKEALRLSTAYTLRSYANFNRYSYVE